MNTNHKDNGQSLQELATETRDPRSAQIDTLSTEGIIRLMNETDKTVAHAVEKEVGHIAAGVDLVVEAIRGGGRLFYVGAGTSGRLGVLDASECPPTFGIDPDLVQAVIAGGEKAITSAAEGAEDDPAAGAGDLAARGLKSQDVVVGIAASGRTPYVIGALEKARAMGCRTIAVTSNSGSPISALADVAITPVVGPEVIMGSTRLKAGTAQKMVLNMLTTAAMVRLGKVYGNLMVDMRPTNSKLMDRAIRMVSLATGCSRDEAKEVLEAAGRNVKVAVVMKLGRTSQMESGRLLDAAGGYVRRALEMAAREQLARMTLEEKIGQMVMFGFPGTAPSPEIRDFIVRNRIGGVILFARNCGTTAQLARLNGKLQALAWQTPRKIPLFIAIDQEGGSVVRLTDGVEVFPGNMALGAARQPENAYLAARITARDLRAAGINVNFAPVLDVNVNAANPVIGVRSFGEDPEMVARLGVAAIRGYQEGGVLATGKHFPGHGDTAVDSHLALPTVPHDRRRLDEVELRPFREAIRTGAGAIMTAHVTFPAVDPAPGMPATLSRKVLTGLLRDELGFEGLIFTDCMEMKAIADNFGSGQAAVMAIQAGADMVLVSHTPSVQQASLEAILAAARAGEIARERIDASVERILLAKQRFAQETRVPEQEQEQGPGHATYSGRQQGGEDDGAALKIAREAVTLVRNEAGQLPLDPASREKLLVVEFALKALTGAEDQIQGAAPFAESLSRQYRGPVQSLIYGLDPRNAEIEAAVAVAAGCDRILVATQNAGAFSGQARLVKGLAASGKPVLVVALRNPYDLVAFPEVKTYLAAYSYQPCALQAASEVITGRLQPTGRLPVAIPGLYPYGHGLGRQIRS